MTTQKTIMALVLGALTTNLAAGTLTWNGGYTGANGAIWNNAANWGGTAFAENSDLVFAGTIQPNTYLGSSHAVNSITFANNAAVFTLSLSTKKDTTGVAANLTFMAGNTGMTVQSGNANAQYVGKTTDLGNVVLAGNVAVNHLGSGALTLRRPVTGAGGLTKTGSGPLVFAANATYSGTTAIEEGAFELADAVSIGGPVTIADGATLNALGTATFSALTLGSGAGLTLSASHLATPPITVGALTLNGGTSLNIVGTLPGLGRYPLIQYTSKTGTGSIAAPQLIPWVATIEVNAANQTVDLVVSNYTPSSTPVPPPLATTVIAADDFNDYAAGDLDGQGFAGYGWSGGWVFNSNSQVSAMVSPGSSCYVLDDALIGGGQSVELKSTIQTRSGLPVASRALEIPQSSTLYAGCVMRFVESNFFTTDDTVGLCLNDAAGVAAGVNFGFQGRVEGGAFFFLRKGTADPAVGPLMKSFAGGEFGAHYLVVKLEKVASGNFNKVTLWIDPRPDSEQIQPNGDMQLLEDLGVSSISQVHFLAQKLDKTGLDRGRMDGLALTTSFADLMKPAGAGPDIRSQVALIRVEAAADGSANAAVPSQILAPGQSVTNYAIARAANGAFIANISVDWKLTEPAGGVIDRDLAVAADGKSAVFTARGAGYARVMALGNAVGLSASGAFTVTPRTNPYERPFIWSRSSERDGILQRSRTLTWAAAQFERCRGVADFAVELHQTNRDGFIRRLPLVTTSGIPKFEQDNVPWADDTLVEMYNYAMECATMYYLTGDTNYARVAADILHNAVQGYVNVPPSTQLAEGGWIYLSLLAEAPATADQLPVTYDYLYDYLQTNPLVYQLQTTGGTDVAFDFADAQTVFRTFYELTRDHGQANNNWSSAMAQMLVPCVLALDNPTERTEALKDYLVRDNARQTSLKTDALQYPNPGDIWPESLDYSENVNTIHPYLMVMLDRYDPALNLLSLYPNIVQSMARPHQLVFPNGKQIHFGDFHDDDAPQPYYYYETVYRHAMARNLPNVRELYGPLINEGIATRKYNRGSTLRERPIPLLWFADEVTEPSEGLQLPRSDTLSHAGVALQRNLSSTGDPDDGLMCFVAGGAYVHSHANGMNMELYGKGEVLGAEGGRGDYGTAIHEKYYRLFAAHNTIIVNGSSRGETGWAGLEINKVQVQAMEPAAFQPAVSSNLSFSCTSFMDTKGTKAEATQQRTLGIVRTSPTTGYYVDIFRSKSTVSNLVAKTLTGNVTDQFHDYIYHNLGDTLEIEANNATLPLLAQAARFQTDIGDAYDQPGWRYFTNTVVSLPTPQSVQAQYNYGGIYMDLHIPAVANREYAKCDAPGIIIPPFAGTKPAPVLAIRQTGEAWDRPFALVFEPHIGDSTVNNVTTLEQGGTVVGLKVESLVDGDPIVQYVLSNPNPADTYADAALGLSFTGRFAVVTDKGNSEITLYLGDGASLTYQGRALSSVSGSNTQAEAQFVPGQTTIVTANSPVSTTFEHAGLDSDGDGMSDSAETAAGRNPTDAGDLAFEFNTGGLTDGWYALANITNLSISGGNLTGTAVTFDPRLNREGFLFDSAAVPAVIIKLKASAAGNLQLFWGNSATPGYSADRRIDVPYLAADAWQALVVPLAGHPEWDGKTIVNLRIDPISVGGAAFEIDWIRASDGDLDGDGILDINEGLGDSDGDGLLDIEDPATPYQAWAFSHALRGPETDDDDQDGLPNLSEYALGGNPTNPADRGHVPTVGTGTTWLDYVHAQRSAPNSGITYTVEVTDDLVSPNWTTNGVEIVGTGVLDAEFDTVTNRIPTETKTEQFIRLLIK